MVDDDRELLGEDGELLGEALEEWDRMFDSLHLPETPMELLADPTAVESTGPAAPGRAEATTTAPPIVPDEDDVDGFPFPLPEDDLQLDGEPRALGALLGSSGRRRPLGPTDEDDGLFTSAVRPPPGTQPPARPAARRSAAIVRRPGTGPKRAWTAPDADSSKTRPGPWGDLLAAPVGEAREDEEGGFWPEERTHTMAAELVERLAESAEALFRDAPPEVRLELDEDFYEGIEVAASAAETQPAAHLPPSDVPAAHVPTAPPPVARPQRATTRPSPRPPTPTGAEGPDCHGWTTNFL